MKLEVARVARHPKDVDEPRPLIGARVLIVARVARHPKDVDAALFAIGTDEQLVARVARHPKDVDVTEADSPDIALAGGKGSPSP